MTFQVGFQRRASVLSVVLIALVGVGYAAADPKVRPLAWLLAGQALYAQNRFREAELNFKHAWRRRITTCSTRS